MSGSIQRTLPTQKAPFNHVRSNAGSFSYEGYPRAPLACSNTLAGEVLKDAVFYIDAQEHQNYGANAKTIRNLGTGRSALDARSGSTSVPDSNDPLFLPYNGTPYVYLPGVNGNNMTVPDETALHISGDLDLIVKVASDSYPPSSSGTLLARDNTGTSRIFSFDLLNNNFLRFLASNDGTTFAVNVTSSVTTGLSAGQVKWFRVTLTANNGATNSDINFYTSDDGITWTQLGTTVHGGVVVSMPAGTVGLGFGDRTVSGSTFTGKAHRAIVKNGINGTTVLDIDTSVITSGSATSFTAATGQTVTINRATSGRKSVAVVAPVWLFGTDDYMQVRDNPAINFAGGDSFTVYAVVRMFGTPTNFGRILSKRLSTTGYDLITNGTTYAPEFDLQDQQGLNIFENSLSASTLGTLATFAGVRNRQERKSYSQNSTGRGPAKADALNDIYNTVPFFIGASNTGGSQQDMVLIAVAIFRRALSATEVATLNTYYQSHWS